MTTGLGIAGVGVPLRAGLSVAVGGFEVAAIGARAQPTKSAKVSQPMDLRKACIESDPPSMGLAPRSL
ncbi:MAG TPA: hypothetical protein VJK02_04030 [Anaerolineales bacterium]|nr:hypothetical protein [Anaerolineales bacterium]